MQPYNHITVAALLTNMRTSLQIQSKANRTREQITGVFVTLRFSVNMKFAAQLRSVKTAAVAAPMLIFFSSSLGIHYVGY